MMGPRRVAIGGGAIVAAGLLLVFLRSTPDAWPYGDQAVIQTYTLQALRGAFVQGPYSQFGWHHPGPMYFYLLAPTYALSGQHAIGLTVGALAINILALSIVWSLTRRHAGTVPAAALFGTLVLFACRANGLVGSVWNPHVIVLPLTAAIVAAAAACSGDRAALVILTVMSSFLMQTHVSMVPLGATLLLIALVATLRTQSAGPSAVRGAIMVATLVGVVLWLPVVFEAVRSHGRTPMALLRFFRASTHPVGIATAVAAWIAMSAAPLSTGFQIPWGDPSLSPPPAAAIFIVPLQAAAVTIVLVSATRTRNRLLQWLAALLIVSAAIALVSISRIPDRVADYQVFWLSGIGALMWATCAAALSSAATRASVGAVVTTIAALLLASVSVKALYDARKYAIDQQFEDVRRREAAMAVRAVIADRRFNRPLLSTSQDAWNEAAAVVLDAYKHHRNLAVNADLVKVFGDPLVANGREDAEIMIAGPGRHAEIANRPGAVTVFDREGLFVDVRPIPARGHSSQSYH